MRFAVIGNPPFSRNIKDKVTNHGGELSELEDCDWLISVNNTRILTEEELSLPKQGCINLHPAPLPEYAGVFCHHWAIHNEEEWFGATAHFMDKGIDTGDIIDQRRFPIHKDLTPVSLYLTAQTYGVGMLTGIIQRLLKGRELVATPQNLNNRKLYTKQMARDAGWVT